MKVTISIDNNKEIIVMPFVTEDMLNIDYGDSPNENKDSVKYSAIKVMGAEPLARISLDAFFPNGKLPFAEPGSWDTPMRYVRWFRDNRKKRKPMRIVITEKDGTSVFNRLMALETFSLDKVNKAGDYFYNMDFEQYRLVR